MKYRNTINAAIKNLQDCLDYDLSPEQVKTQLTATLQAANEEVDKISKQTDTYLMHDYHSYVIGEALKSWKTKLQSEGNLGSYLSFDIDQLTGLFTDDTTSFFVNINTVRVENFCFHHGVDFPTHDVYKKIDFCYTPHDEETQEGI